MNKKLIAIIFSFLIIFNQVIVVSAEPKETDFIELPENLVEPYELLLDTIETNQEIIEIHQTAIDGYEFIGTTARARLKMQISDLSTELTSISNELRSSSSTDFEKLILDVKDKLILFNKKYVELNDSQQLAIEEEIYMIHLDEFKKTIKSIHLEMESDTARDNRYDEIKTRLEMVDEQIEVFEQDKSESNWFRLEERFVQLKESIVESIS